jgi:hypothetical protein
LRRQLRYDGAEGGCPWAVVVIAGLVADTEDAAREVVQDIAETAVARFQRDPADVEQFIPVEMRLGLRLKADVITFVRYFWKLSIK